MKDILKNWTAKDYICSALAVLLITTFGLWLLRRDLKAEGRLTEDLPILSIAAEKPETVPEIVEEPAPKTESGIRADGLVNINIASPEELMTLPNIGEAMAERIIAQREKAPFKQRLDIKKVSGIGDKTYDILKDRICVSNED